jgi:DNA-nicking Smr family endonuclease
MKSRKPSLTCHSFEDLLSLLKGKSISFPDRHCPSPDPIAENHKVEAAPEFEEKLFTEAMEGVTPIGKTNCIERISYAREPENSRRKEDAETLSKLEDLVHYGTGFNVFETPEYVEGTGYNIHPEVARRLHHGDYSIQARLDLHGLNADAAKEAFEDFLKWAVITDKRGVLVIHGRGLSSPSEPVLKKKVLEWLTRGPWRKWIIAYSSARSCDGGAGATYVLLRKRPVSKRLKRRPTIRAFS